jgi:hypothetical protein
MTDRNRTMLIWGGWIVAIIGLLIEFVGYQSPAFLSGKSVVVGSVMVLIGIIITVYARRKAPV